MTFQESEALTSQYINDFRSSSFFKLNGEHAQFLGLIIAPADSSIEEKQFIYDNCIKNGVDNKMVLLESGLWNKEMNVFLIYLQGGRDLIIPLESYLNSASSAS